MSTYRYQCTNKKHCHYGEDVAMSIKADHPEILKDCPAFIFKEKADGEITEKKCKGKLKKIITGGCGFIIRGGPTYGNK